jgi:hypothetical protein
MAAGWRRRLVCLALGLVAVIAVAAAEGPPPDEELLEFLGLWDPEDEDWLGAELADTGADSGDGEIAPDTTEIDEDEH